MSPAEAGAGLGQTTNRPPFLGCIAARKNSERAGIFAKTLQT